MWGGHATATQTELRRSRVDLATSMVPADIGGASEKYMIGGVGVCRAFWGSAVDAPDGFFNITRSILRGDDVSELAFAPKREVTRPKEQNAAAWALGYVRDTGQEWRGRICTTKSTVSAMLWPLYVAAQFRAAGLQVR